MSRRDRDVISGFRGRYSFDTPLAAYTTWDVGGKASVFVEPSNVDDIIAVNAFAKLNDLPICVIGHGSNVLIDDSGIPGIVLCMRKSYAGIEQSVDTGIIRAQAGCPLPLLANSAANSGIAGFEFLAGIPGSVGGAIVTNAGVGGSEGHSIKELLLEATVLDVLSGEICVYSPSDLGMCYRHSNVIERHLIVLDAAFFSDKSGSPDRIKSKQREIIELRRQKQPSERNTAGSVFKQAESGRAAGWYIDQAGLKGKCIGGAVVSNKHANWIINTGNATSNDIRELIDIIVQTVREKHGVTLEREIKILPDDMHCGAGRRI